MNITHDTLIAVIVCVGLAVLVLTFFYEREITKQQRLVKDLQIAMLDRTFDWLSQRQDNERLRAQQAWSFSDSLHHWLDSDSSGWANKHGGDHEITAPLFDAGLMKGNQD